MRKIEAIYFTGYSFICDVKTGRLHTNIERENDNKHADYVTC